MIYEYWLAGIKEITDLKKQKLREVYGSGKAIYYIEETKLDKLRFLNEKDVAILKNAKKDTKLEEKWRKTEEKRIQFIPYFLKTYPEKLKYITDPPYALYVLGQLPDEKRKSAAIVGARNCTAYGEQMALQYGKSLAEAGIQIISGMARGIDGAGQRGALNSSWAKESGVTYAVLGCGVDVCYPRDHIGLYMDIIEHGGGILSEFQLGTPPLAMNFPMRNRIISGLSDAVLVMEARIRSGSLITADMALEQGKDVYALPGPLDSPLSAGCNHLIQQGAGILLNPENLLEEWGIETNVLCRNTEIKNEKNKKVLESTDDLVYSCVGLYPKNVDQIAQESRVEIRKLMSILVTLELQGYIREITKNYYIRIK